MSRSIYERVQNSVLATILLLGVFSTGVTSVTPSTFAASTATMDSTSSVNPFRAKFTAEFATAIDAVVTNIASRGKDLTKEKYIAYLGRVADGIKSVAALPKYQASTDVQNVAGYIAYEVNAMRTALTKDTSFLDDMSSVVTNALSDDATPTAPVKPTDTPTVPVQPTATVPAPILEVQNMKDGSAYLSWTIVKGQKYELSYVGGMGGGTSQEYSFSSVLTGNSGCTYERKEGGYVLCSGKWNNFPGNYSIQTFGADGKKSTKYAARLLSVNSGKFSWEDAYSAQQVELRNAEMIAKENNRPGNAASGAVVRTLPIFTGKLGGLAGANTKCLQQLQENEWMGKDRFTLDENHVRAYLCDANKCQNLKPNTSYYSTNLEVYKNDPYSVVDSPKGGKTFVQNIDLDLGKTDRYGRLMTSDQNLQGVVPFNSLYRDGWGYSFIGWSGRQGYMSSAANTCDSWTSDEAIHGHHTRPIDAYASNDKLGAVARKYVSNHSEIDETTGTRSKVEQFEYSNSGESCGFKQALICTVEL